MKPFRPLRRIIATLAIALVVSQPLSAGGPVVLPSIGESTEAYLSADDERLLGEAFMRSVRRALPLVDDPEVQVYLETLGTRLVAGGGLPESGFTFFAVRDPAINAFAGPGGYIGVNTGLFLTSETEAELASVLAHEVAHVTQRHIARAFEAASRMSLPVTAAIIAALILGSRANGNLGEAAIAATTAGSIQQQINFTRSNEEEADRVGLQILADAGFEPRAMPRFFERLHQATQFYDNQNLEFLRTHPVTVTRISDTRNRAEQYPELGEAVTEGYRLMREKVRVLQAGDPVASLSRYEALLSDDAGGDGNDALRYGYALALNAAGRHGEARRQLEALLEEEPERIAYRIALAQARLGSGDVTGAVSTLERTLAIYPHDYPLTVHLAEALLQAGRPQEAMRLIADYHRARPARAKLHLLAARAARLSGDGLAAHQTLADYYAHLGEIGPAIDQLKLALRLIPRADDVRATRIEARIQALREEWRVKAKFSGETPQLRAGSS